MMGGIVVIVTTLTATTTADRTTHLKIIMDGTGAVVQVSRIVVAVVVTTWQMWSGAAEEMNMMTAFCARLWRRRSWDHSVHIVVTVWTAVMRNDQEMAVMVLRHCLHPLPLVTLSISRHAYPMIKRVHLLPRRATYKRSVETKSCFCFWFFSGGIHIHICGQNGFLR